MDIDEMEWLKRIAKGSVIFALFATLCYWIALQLLHLFGDEQ